MSAPGPDKAKCGGKGKNGKPCGLTAGHGTDHPGYGRCKFHTGSTPNGVKAAAKQEVDSIAARYAAAMGEGVESDPYEAILTTIRQTSAEVALFGSLAPSPERGPFVATMFGPQLHAAVAERQKAQKRLVHFAKVAIDAGVAQRQVDIAERLGKQLGMILQRIVAALDLTPQQMQRVPELVRGELELIVIEA